VRLLTIETADPATTVVELVATEHTMSTVDPRLSTLDLRLVHLNVNAESSLVLPGLVLTDTTGRTSNCWYGMDRPPVKIDTILLLIHTSTALSLMSSVQ
jgi:hypothetical protein